MSVSNKQQLDSNEQNGLLRIVESNRIVQCLQN